LTIVQWIYSWNEVNDLTIWFPDVQKLKLKVARGSNESNDDPEGLSSVLAPKSPTKSEPNLNQITDRKFNNKGSENEKK
jgi:hypothetical protein